MDNSNATQDQFEIGIDDFLAGKTLACNGVVFWIDDKNNLFVYSYQAENPENATREIAQDKINNSKLVLKDLINRSPRFKKAVRRLTHQFLFCHDYGKAATPLAKEVNGKIIWLR